ncbi:MAG: winged helix-turn-helix transcriptional regulator [Chitinophagaceae bacterium]|nr:winged helix-turn-helix transcriptional regulator [Oligoflexus sp.]
MKLTGYQANCQNFIKHPLSKILGGGEASIRVIRVLCEFSNQHLSLTTLSQKTGLSLNGVKRTIEELEDLGIVQRAGTGSRRLYSLRRAHPLAEVLTQLFVGEQSLESTLKNTTISDYPKILIFGGPTKSSNSLYRLSMISRDGAGLKIKEKNCRVTVPPASGLSMSIADSIIQSIDAIESPLAAKATDGGIEIRRGDVTQIVGAKLTNPTAELPNSENDPEVIQVNGKPLVVTHAVLNLPFPLKDINVDLYAVQRSTNSYNAVLNANGELHGFIKDTTEQSVLGTSLPIPSVNLNKVPVKQDPDASKSTVSFMKIADGASCDEVVEAYGLEK